MSGMGRVLPKGEKLLVPFDSYVAIGEVSFAKSEEVEQLVAEVEASVLQQREILLNMNKQ
jgi:hypothetical protein